MASLGSFAEAGDVAGLGLPSGTGVVKVTAGVGSVAVAGADYEVGLGQAYYKALAISRLGLTAGDKAYGFHWHDFDTAQTSSQPLGWQVAAVGTGTAAIRVAGGKGGLVRIAAGATNGGILNMFSNASLVAAISTDKWWFGVRQAVKTAITAQTVASSGLYDFSAKTVHIGVFGTSVGGGGTTSFTLQYDGDRAGTFVSTGVAIDTAMHVFEVYCKGDSKIYYRTDEGNEASVTPAAASALAQMLFCTVANGSDNVDRQMDLDFVACLYPR